VPANNIKARPESRFKRFDCQVAVQFVPAAQKPPEHRIVRANELNHEQIGCQFGREVDNTVEGNALGNEHMVDDRQHQHGVK
jgi:hypothetical protein